MRMRLLLRVVAGLASLLVSLLVVLILASFVFNATTSGEGKPVRSLWDGRFVDADGVLTAFREWGSQGTPVVLVGGFMEPTFVWEEVAPLLARAHRVYALDLDGFGYTERRGPWTLAEWADQVQGFMRRLGISRPIVVGHSLGAAVALELARRRSTSRIVLLDGDALGSGGAPWFVRAVLRHTPLVRSVLRLATRWDRPAKELLENAYGPRHPPLDHSLVRRWTKQLEAVGAEHALETIAGRPLPGFSRATMRTLRVRATVVWGAEDDVDGLRAGRRTGEDLSARVIVIPDAGHLSLLSAPVAVARAIEARP
jgi:pimeloyl-ACP methyl ester carboxylesterase